MWHPGWQGSGIVWHRPLCLSHTTFDLCLNQAPSLQRCKFLKLLPWKCASLVKLVVKCLFSSFRACSARCHHLGNLELSIQGLGTNVPCPVLPQQYFGEGFGIVLCCLGEAEAGCCRDSSRKSAFPQLHNQVIRQLAVLS